MNAELNGPGRSDDSCELCGDVALPGRVLAVSSDARTATVQFECRTEAVALDFMHASVGDTVLVHLGFAIALLEEP